MENNNNIQIIDNNIIFLKDNNEIAKITSDINGNIIINSSTIRKDLNIINDFDLLHRQDLNHHINSSNPHNLTKIDIGLSNVQNLKDNYIGTRPPNQNDNLLRGYTSGSRWIDRLSEHEYICINSTQTTAKWLTTTSTTGVISDSEISYNFTWSSQKIIDELENINNFGLKLDGISAPDLNNDSSEGYSVGSRWYDILTKKEYVCLDSAVGNAVWKETTATDSLATVENIGTGGVGIYKDNIGNSIKLKKLRPLSTKLSVVNNLSDNTVDIDIVEGIININNLTGILSVGNGGTGRSSLPSNKFLSGNGTDSILTIKDIPSGVVVGTIDSQILTNKSIDADENIITNLDNNSIKNFAGIDVTKLGDGTVSNVKLSYLNTLTGNIQTQINNHLNNNTNPHNVTKDQLGLNNVQNIKNNFSSTSNPTVLHDIISGYSIGSKWLNISSQKEFVCVQNVALGAVWIETTQPSGEVNIASNIGSGKGIYSTKFGPELRFKSLIEGDNIMLSSTANEITIVAINTHNFLLSPVPVAAIGTLWKGICNFSWKNSEFLNYKDGRVVFEVVLQNRNIDIQMYNLTENSVLGFHTTISHSGFYSFPIANPGNDARMELQIKKTLDGGVDPKIYGLVLKYNS